MDVLVCPGPVTLTGEGAPLCVDGWTVQPYVAPFDPSQLDPTTIAACVGVGFFVLLPLWVAVYGGRALLSVIR